MSSLERLREAKVMLDEGLISKSDYDAVKRKCLGASGKSLFNEAGARSSKKPKDSEPDWDSQSKRDQIAIGCYYASIFDPFSPPDVTLKPTRLNGRMITIRGKLTDNGTAKNKPDREIKVQLPNRTVVVKRGSDLEDPVIGGAERAKFRAQADSILKKEAAWRAGKEERARKYAALEAKHAARHAKEEAERNKPKIYTAVVPQGAAPGQRFSIRIADGRVMQLTVPAGAVPGSTFSFAVAPPPKPKPPPPQPTVSSSSSSSSSSGEPGVLEWMATSLASNIWNAAKFLAADDCTCSFSAPCTCGKRGQTDDWAAGGGYGSYRKCVVCGNRDLTCSCGIGPEFSGSAGLPCQLCGKGGYACKCQFTHPDTGRKLRFGEMRCYLEKKRRMGGRTMGSRWNPGSSGISGGNNGSGRTGFVRPGHVVQTGYHNPVLGAYGTHRVVQPTRQDVMAQVRLNGV